MNFSFKKSMPLFSPRHMWYFSLVGLCSSKNCSPLLIFPLSLIHSVLLSFCILTVLNFWQTSRSTKLSCPAAVVFSPTATPVTVWPSSPSPPAPNPRRFSPGPGLGPEGATQRHLRRGFPQPSSPTRCLLKSGTPPWGLLVSWVAEEERDAAFFSGSDILSWKWLNRGTKCQSDTGIFSLVRISIYF